MAFLSWLTSALILSQIMPQENTNPAAKTEPVEFEFNAPLPENPRMRKRNLKVRTPAESAASAPAAQPTPERAQAAAVYAQPAAATHTAPSGPVYARPSDTAERTQPAPASGVLYYSSNPGTKKEDSMKSLPHPQAAARPTTASQSTTLRAAASASQPAAARPATGESYSQRSTSAASTPQASGSRPAAAASTTASSPFSSAGHASSGSRPSSPASSSPSRAVSTTVASPSPSAARAAGVSDYRSNIDRQAREQKSIGSILNLAVYALVGFFILATALAAYGAHDVYKQLHAQSTTVSELDARYSAANQAMTDKLTSTQAGIQQVQAQLSHAQELILRQQDLLTKMQATLDTQAQALREERATRAAETSIRAQETAVLRSRLRALEAKNETYRP